jgi:hypothetical protein
VPKDPTITPARDHRSGSSRIVADQAFPSPSPRTSRPTTSSLDRP